MPPRNTALLRAATNLVQPRHGPSASTTRAVFAAGGFSGSKYVMGRLQAELGAAAFNQGVTSHPGEAVLQGGR